ncbi:hypothetical protein SRHO_G00332080 [Serrasalmus rhombeus]
MRRQRHQLQPMGFASGGVNGGWVHTQKKRSLCCFHLSKNLCDVIKRCSEPSTVRAAEAASEVVKEWRVRSAGAGAFAVFCSPETTERLERWAKLRYRRSGRNALSSRPEPSAQLHSSADRNPLQVCRCASCGDKRSCPTENRSVRASPSSLSPAKPGEQRNKRAHRTSGAETLNSSCLLQAAEPGLMGAAGLGPWPAAVSELTTDQEVITAVLSGLLPLMTTQGGIRRIFSRSEAGLRKLGGVKVASLSNVTVRASPFKPACAAARDEEKSGQRKSTSLKMVCPALD